MAKMIPEVFDASNESYGEEKVFYALKDGLPSDYTVFHSFRWNKRIRSGRIEWGEADFTIFHPSYGLLVIEVKSGAVALEDGQWWYAISPQYKPMKAPLEQADRTKYELVDILKGSLPDGEFCWVESAVWFPSLDDRSLIKDMPCTYHPEIVLMEWALKNTKQAIENAYNFYNSAQNTRLSPKSAKHVVKILAPAFSAIPSLSSIYTDQELSFFRMTTEQNGLLDYLEEQPTAVIQGGAGTGKTLLAVEKARRLSEQDPVLFLCFNRFLMEDLRKKNQDCSIDFYNLPSLVIRESGFSDYPTDDDITDYLNRYDEAESWNYKHIIVDEGQDFNDLHLSLLSTIAGIQKGVFYVFYDKNQLVQRPELPEWVQNAECRLVLRKNCRNTTNIAKTAGSPINFEPALHSKAPEGKRPDFYFLNDGNSFTRKISNIISKYIEANIPPHQITILSMKTEDSSILSEVKNIGKWPISSTRNEVDVLFTTARKFKGLESDAIIIIDVDASTFDSPKSRNLFYVGASRAKNFLDIITLLDDYGLSELGQALCEEPISKDIKRKIAATLKVRISK